MTITPSGLIRASGVAAAAAGAIFIGVQIAHPPMDVATVDTADWVLRSTAKAVMAVMALAGITGLYARQVRETGVLGLVGYLLFAGGYLLMLPVVVIAAFVLPPASYVAQDFVADVMVTAFGGSPVGDIGLLPAYFAVAGVLFAVGGAVFGVALYRAGVVARWASALLTAGALGTMLLAVLPDSFNRPMAVPTGLALIGLGVSLARDRGAVRTVDVTSQPSAAAVVAR